MKAIILTIFIFPLGVLAELKEEDFKSQAQKTLKPFKKELMSTLKKTLGQKGAVEAIEVCNVKAPEIRKKVNQKNKRVMIQDRPYRIEMGRTSHKLRNPNNRPKDWMRSYLKEFQRGERSSAVVAKRDKDFSKVGYLAPIGVQPLCLNCHGTNLSSGVKEVLTQKYPQDEATGFSVGDFRGLFWVEFTAK